MKKEEAHILCVCVSLSLFPAVHKAYKTLEDPEQLEYCKSIWEEATATIEQKVNQLKDNINNFTK